ncbi:MAG: PD40 domain-containing protein [Phycisphaerales bacterium]|nr:MAG: PD40 domain-containing protein [Phycisphaerales bacterium]
MRQAFDNARRILFWWIPFYLSCMALGFIDIAPGSQPTNESELGQRQYEKSELNLKAIPFKIIYETFRETDGKENWELLLINADGSNATNLTRTPDVDEMYPQACPDGTKICFVTDEKKAKSKVRNVYYMNIDGTGRVKVAEHARQPCWSPDGKTIAYLKDEYERYTTRPYGTKELFFYDIETGRHKQHPNKDLHHVSNICWSSDGDWFVAFVSGGMGFAHNIIAFEAKGTRVFDLKTKYGVSGCRPDLSSDGKTIGWGESSEMDVFVADIDLTLSIPRVANVRGIARCEAGNNVNQVDFSPDCRYVAFACGPDVDYSVGVKAPGWNICVSDLSGKWVQITADGKHNKEPDWVPIRTLSR